MTKKKGRSKGGGPGGDREMEDDDASTEEETSTGVAEPLNESDTINQRVNDKAQATSPRCPHVGKAVNVPAIKKALKAAWIPIGRCGVCTREKRTANQAPLAGKKGQTKGSKSTPTNIKGKASNPSSSVSGGVDPNKPFSVWLCLRCGAQSCRPNLFPSNDKVGHALAHFKVPRSDLHCICVNVTPPTPSEDQPSRWDIFCFECNSNLYLDSYKKLHEAVEFVKRVSETKTLAPSSTSKQPSKGTAIGAKTPASHNTTGTGANQNTTEIDGAITKSRGLVNLGNTCFFNSVIQGLTQSHPLTYLLLARKYCQKGTPFELPRIQQDPLDHSKDRTPSLIEKLNKPLLEEMTLALDEAGNMTLSFASFLSEMANGTAKGVVNPSQIFGQICSRSPQFRGFQQQDAHELLRHLIEGLRIEEVKRQRKAILKFFGLSEKTDPKTVVGETRQKLQALKQYSNYTIVDRIFGGHLVSTIVCEVCHNSSQNYEPFLDLSLPLIEERDHPPTSKQKQNHKKCKNNPEEEYQRKTDNKSSNVDLNFSEKDEKKSKHQLKKEKEKNRKEKRKNKRGNRKDKLEFISAENDTIKDQNKKVEELLPTKLNENESIDKEEKTSLPQMKVIVESASDCKDEKDSNTSQDKTKERLQLQTTTRTPLDKEVNQNRSRSVSPNISERVKALSRDPSPSEQKNEGGGSNSSPNNSKSLLNKSNISKNLQKFEKEDSSRLKKNQGKVSRGGSEEDDEGDAYLDEDEEWEWEYDEPAKENKEDEISDTAVAGSDHNTDEEELTQEKPKLVSLNPLPPERLLPSDHERSSLEQGDGEEQLHQESEVTTGESSNADIEDNIDIDIGVTSVNASSVSNTTNLMNRMYSVESSTAEWASTTTSLLEKPFQPNPDHLDPHMEQLCKNIQKLSVTTSTLQDTSILVDNAMAKDNKIDMEDAADIENSASNSSAYQTATAATANTNGAVENSKTEQNKANGINDIEDRPLEEDRTLEEDLHQMQLQNEWVTRSLTSIAPRYRTQPGECSVYSCLTQFTAPELLAGNNKWACGRCSKLRKGGKIARRESNKTLPCNDNGSDTSTEDDQKSKTNQNEIAGASEKNEVVYSNASKQLLVFCPPAVLTIHLKRFQQTMTGLRKVSKHVQFPLILDMAPFCSSTSMAMTNVPSGVKEIKYYLFGVVEHSGRLQGGHYTAYVKTRNSPLSNLPKESSSNSPNYYNQFYSSPNSKTEQIEDLLKIIEGKSKQFNQQHANILPAEKQENLSDITCTAANAALNSDACQNLNNFTGSTNRDSNEFIPNGKWYHISDSHVTEVAQEKVLKSQAYILLYERIK